MDTDRSPSPTEPHAVDLDLGRGLTLTLQPRLNPLYTAIAHVLPRQGQALLSVTARNDGDTPRDLTVTVRVDRFSDPESKPMRVAPGVPTTLDFFPAFIPGEIARLDTLHRATLQVEVTEDGRSNPRSLPLDLLAVNTAPLFADDPTGGAPVDLTRYLAVYVTPDDADLDALVREAVDHHLPPGVQFNSNGRHVDAQVGALYAALAARGIRYDSATFALDPAAARQTSQRVRLPAQVLASGLANCLEGVFLLASLLVKHKIETAIVLLPPGHALLGWQPDRDEPAWRYLEVTRMGDADFAQAQQTIAAEHFVAHDAQATAPRTRPRRWELTKLRASGIVPLPLDPDHAPLVKALARMADDVAAAVLAEAERQEQERLRGAEVEYLEDLRTRYEHWATHYTPLAGIAEVRAAAQDGPRLDLPALFMPTGFEKLEEHGFGMARRTERIPVEDLRTAVERYRRLVVLGEPGSGKTTTLWRLAYELAEHALEDPHAPLPILVPLGGYTGEESALDFVATRCREVARSLQRYLRNRRAILLLDALNEMPQRRYAVRVARIQSFLNEYPNVSVVVTCRVRDYVETLNLEKLEVKPLDPARQLAYLQRYLDDDAGARCFWTLAGDDMTALWQRWQVAGGTWEQFLRADDIPPDVYRKTSRRHHELWKAFRRGQLPALWELGVNPYMLTMLAQVYAAGDGALPQNRGKLFAAFVDTLLERERKRREARDAPWPGAAPIEHALAELAFAMQSEGERGTAVDVAWAKTYLGRAVCPADEAFALGVDATLLDSNGDTVRFVHQLIQEYFAARAWEAKLPGDDLYTYWPDGWLEPTGWEETAILLAGILPEMSPLLKKLLPVNPVLAARCVAESGGKVDPATKAAVQTNLEQIVTGTSVPLKPRAAAGNALNHLGDARSGVGLDASGLPAIAWCEVPAGEFLMGNTEKTDDQAEKREMPQRTVYLATFHISRYPITNDQYQRFVEEGGYTEQWRHCWTDAGWKRRADEDWTGPLRYGGDFDLPNHPVVGVSWYEAVAFCRWLSERTGRGIMLPTEAQWEKAARGTDGRRYPWGDEITPEHANFDSKLGATSAVGVFPQGVSPYGVHDMAGNAWEWCRTTWVGKYSEYAKASDELDGGADRTLRGGSWGDSARFVRCADRGWYFPYVRLNDLGFRVVWSPGF